MPFTIQMPKLGHTMTEGTVLKWHKHAGDDVREGEAVLTVETDKAEIEIESPAAGVLARVLADEGMVVGVGLPLGEILRTGEAATEGAPSPARSSTVPGNSGAGAPHPPRAAAAAAAAGGGGGFGTRARRVRPAAAEGRLAAAR